MTTVVPLTVLLALLTTAQEPAKESPAAPDRLPKPAPAEPPPAGAIEKSLQRGITFLLQNQNRDGSWGSPVLRGGVQIYAPVPGAHHAFHAAVTAMCISALIEVGGESTEVRRTIERGEAWLMERLPAVRRGSADALYNIWTHIYGIQALVRMHSRLPTDGERRRKIEELIRHQIGMLERFESIDGGWGYYDFTAGTQRPASSSTSFMNAAALVALHEARQIGISVPERLTRRAIDSTLRQHLSDGSYLYGEYLKYEPRHPINRPGGSLGRTQSCNIALRLWQKEKVSDTVLRTWLDRLFARNLWLDLGRKRPYPHESHFAVAGYFFFFGHYYAALCMEQLPAAERPFYQDHLAQVLLRVQSKDGSWWDFPLYDYHQYYGTPFALMALKRCQRMPADAPAP
jgi:hypothetical protein